MKILLHIILVFIAMQSRTNAQCAVNYKEILENNCTGVYLRHQDFSNTTENVINLILTKDNRYAIYLLNPSSSLPKLKLQDKNTTGFKEFKETIVTERNYSVYTFNVKETGEYLFELEFTTDVKACVLLAIYLRNENNFKSGIYKSFDEFRYQNPDDEFSCTVSSKKQTYGKGQILSYKLELERKKRKEMGDLFGFCDGKDMFICINYPSLSSNPEFVKLEYIRKYYYYEYVEYIPVFSGTVVTVVPKRVQKILDMNTGEAKLLNRKYLQEILANDQSLLEEFNNSSHKDRVLKEYLVRYLEKYYIN